MALFDDGHENEMFSKIRKELEKSANCGNKAILLGNISAGSQIDAILIGSNSIIVIEMKDYSGAVTGRENGEWYCTTGRGAVQINKGRENPYLQVRQYRGNVVDKIKKESIRLGIVRAKDLEDRWINFVSGLVVFNKLTSFDSDIDFARSKWFRVTDMGGVVEKVQQMSSSKMELTDREIDIVAKIIGEPITEMKEVPAVVPKPIPISGVKEFTGCAKIHELKLGCRKVPDLPGVYQVLYAGENPPTFLEKGTGPPIYNYSVKFLEDNWVKDSRVVYIGQTSNSLRKRIGTFIRYGAGKDAPHRGGRAIWQIDGSDDLMICWKSIGEESSDSPREREIKMLKDFKEAHDGRLPFANMIE